MARNRSSILALLLTFLPVQVWAQAAESVNQTGGKKPELGETMDLQANEFKNDTRLGVVFSTGNTGSLALNGNNATKYRIRRFENNVRAGAHYHHIQSTTGPTGTGTFARYIYGTYRLDYYFLPRTTVYVGGGGYTDEIKGIEASGQGFGGLMYYFFREKHRDLGASVGYDVTFEDRIAPTVNDSIHSATAGLVYRHNLTESLTVSQTVDLQENVEKGKDFRLQSQSDVKVNVATHVAIGVGVSVRIDNQPVPGFKKLDTLSDLALTISF